MQMFSENANFNAQQWSYLLRWMQKCTIISLLFSVHNVKSDLNWQNTDPDGCSIDIAKLLLDRKSIDLSGAQKNRSLS